MNTLNKTVRIKKIPYYVLLASLTLGASLILGFLSFGGMYVIFPILPLAFAAFALSVAYEGEIYIQNVKGSLKKLFKNNYLERHFAKEFLLNHFPEDLEDENCPQFFKDYASQLQLLDAFSHKHLNASSSKRKQQIEKTLTDMEKWFAVQLFSEEVEKSTYAQALDLWLSTNQKPQWQQRLSKRKLAFTGLKVFCFFAGAFMTLGTTYLIVEAFSVIPFFLAIPFGIWPAIIVPMALIAGIAYGLLTYNAVTDMVNNDTIVKWYHKLRQDWQQGLTRRNVLMTSCAVFLLAITIALTICTAGTWWTVGSKARPLFGWMARMPKFIMSVLNPIISAISAVCFNFQNTAETFEMIDEATKDLFDETNKSTESFWQKVTHSLHDTYTNLRQTENTFQLLNPFRIILKLTITPLRYLFFLGHLISIGVTADRMPGLPEIIAALIAITSEGFEDAHYFIDHDPFTENEQAIPRDLPAMLNERLNPEQSHSHEVDLPTRILKTVTIPIYVLAALWDYYSSLKNTNDDQRVALSFKMAWNKQRGIVEGQEVHTQQDAKQPSTQWKQEHALSVIDKHKKKQLQGALFGREVAQEKIAQLDKLKHEIENSSDMTDTLTMASDNPSYNRHRLFNLQSEKTSTQVFVEELPERVLGLIN